MNRSSVMMRGGKGGTHSSSVFVRKIRATGVSLPNKANASEAQR
jgi:hypothetical protein